MVSAAEPVVHLPVTTIITECEPNAGTAPYKRLLVYKGMNRGQDRITLTCDSYA